MKTTFLLGSLAVCGLLVGCGNKSDDGKESSSDPATAKKNSQPPGPMIEIPGPGGISGGPGGGRGGFGGGRGRGRSGGIARMMPLMIALDTDKDNVISKKEIENATNSLKTLDKNKDGKLTEDELRPDFSGFSGRGRGQRGGRSGRSTNRKRLPLDNAVQPNSKTKSKTKSQTDISPGLKVGEKAIPFELKDQSGKTQTLAGLMKSGKVALVFYRSADW